jgi:tetratricopeptide (TPR) repeat protein
VNYWIGATYAAMGKAEAARSFFEKAAHGAQPPSGESELGYYRGLALRALGLEQEATEVFDELISAGRQQLEASEDLTFFAKFGERTRRESRMADAHYLVGLGHLGRCEREQAQAEFEKALALNINHLWARRQLAEFK